MRHTGGIDVGGTSTDLIAHGRIEDRVVAWTASTAPDHPGTGIPTGLTGQVPADEIGHPGIGRTVATDAIPERKCTAVASVRTRDFREVPSSDPATAAVIAT